MIWVYIIGYLFVSGISLAYAVYTAKDYPYEGDL